MSFGLNVRVGGRPAGFRHRPLFPARRGPSRFHFNFPASSWSFRSPTIRASRISITGTSVLCGVAALITGVALVAFGALTLNPLSLGLGICFLVGGLALTGSGGIYMGIRSWR